MPLDGRVRVLWLINQLGPGGAERLLLATAATIDRSVFDVQAVYLLDWNDGFAPELERLGVPTRSLGVNSVFDARWIGRLARILTTTRFDVVHIHSPTVAAFARLILHLWPLSFPRPRIVVTEHGSAPMYRRSVRSLNAMTAFMDDERLAVSEAAKESFPAYMRRSTRVLVHGIDVEEVGRLRDSRPRVRKELGLEDDDVAVLTVANFRAQKDYPNLLAAARFVLQRSPKTRFFAAGMGPLEKQIHDLHAELDLGPRFQFLGARNDAPRLMAGADIFVLASLNEGYPIALMEALAAGLPIVATAVGGVQDAIVDGREGLLVPPGRADLLADAVLRLAADENARSRMAQAAMDGAHRYDIRPVVRHLEGVYSGRCAKA